MFVVHLHESSWQKFWLLLQELLVSLNMKVVGDSVIDLAECFTNKDSSKGLLRYRRHKYIRFEFSINARKNSKLAKITVV